MNAPKVGLKVMTDDKHNRIRTDILPWRILGWIADLAAVGCLAFMIHLHTRTTALEIWKAETSANRYTMQNHNDYAREQANEMTRIWQEMATMKTEWLKQINDLNMQMTTLPQRMTIPPKWWEDYVRRELGEHEKKISELERRRE